ncbi:MAG TPA: AAA domain-containing protein, partial [Polyangiales bacterium]|nr:AAA domain-containing protein [Polyangiales bacterium]
MEELREHYEEATSSEIKGALPATLPRVASIEPAVLIDYWCNALDFVDFKTFGRARGSKYVEPLERFRLEDVNGHGAAPDEHGETPKGEDVNVVLTVWEGEAERLRSDARRHFLLAVPARLTEDHYLAPRTDAAPVINSAYLHPDISPGCFALGERSAADHGLVSALANMAEDRSRIVGWSVWWNTSLSVLRELLDVAEDAELLDRLSGLIDTAERDNKDSRGRQDKRRGAHSRSVWTLVAAVYPASGGATKEIRAVYTAAAHLLRQHPGRLQLLERLCAGEHAQLVHLLPASASAALIGHIDELDNSTGKRVLFPLDDAQRRAVTAILSLRDGELQAVNGPPGSGKTSMLRAVVASQWVSAALSHGPCPITVACGATNQSVTNVIEAFGKAPHPDASLPHAQRWIGDVTSYGAFLPARSFLNNPRERAGLERFVCLKQYDGGGFPYEYWNRPDPLAPLKALDYEQQYLKCARLALRDGEIGTVEAAVRRVWEQLRALENERVMFCRDAMKRAPTLDRAWDRLKLVQSIWTKARYESAGMNLLNLQRGVGGVEAGEAVMDLLWRADAFHWAARYWEGRFLLAQRERLLSRHSQNVEEALRRICMLTPCIVSTLHTTPRLCEIDARLVHSADQVRHVTALFDLLVVDEAGQASPELAAASFALARRAAVVGDVKQLAPIWNHSSLSEIALAAHAGASSALSQIVQSRRSVASGSMLAAARLVSRWRERDDLGVALCYHYRCKPSIIEYCNALSYERRLITCTKEDDLGPEPALAWVSVMSQPTAAGGSWVNHDEVDEIVSWVVERWPVWREHAVTRGKQLHEIVALITPYRPQAQRLKAALVEAFNGAREASGNGWPSAEAIENVVVGTVHKLQGAEKPIVCFSLVEGVEQGGGSFLDGDATLLNVAVSRAKRSFVVFANPERLFPAAVIAEVASMTKDARREGISRLTPTHQLGAHLKLSGASPLYPKRLVLIEAVHKRDTLAAMLGKQSAVLATSGALTKLVIGEGVDVAAGFVPRPQHEASASAFIAAASELLESVKDVVLATDDDQMGEYISWQIKRLLSARLCNHHQLRRARFGSITRSAVEAAISNATDLDARKVVAEVVREIVDCLITERFTAVMRDSSLTGTAPPSLEPFERAGIIDSDGLSGSGRTGEPILIGRVQAAVLRLLVARAREVVEQEHLCRILTVVRLGENTLTGEVQSAEGRSETKKQTAPAVLEQLSRASLALNGAPTVLRESASAPHAGTISLMAEAWRRFGMTPWETQDALQALYDGSWLGTTREAARERAAFDPDDPIEPSVRRGHPPVTPLDRAATPEQMAGVMANEDCRRIYSLVWDRFALSEAGPYDVIFADVELLLNASRAGRLRVSIRAASCRLSSGNARREGTHLRE